MTNLIEKKFKNIDLGVEITSYIDKQQIIWFLGKDVAEILGYSKTRDALSRHVDNEDKKLICCRPQNVDANNSDLLIMPTYPKWARWHQVVVCALI